MILFAAKKPIFQNKMRNIFSGTILHAAAEVRKQGVMIGFAKRLEWQMYETVVDTEGQFLLIHGATMGTQWIIVDVYAPQNRKTAFF